MDRSRLLPVEHLSKDVQNFFDVLNEEADLPAILVASSYIDACLASILKKKLRESSVPHRLLDINGPSASISSRADVCYLLGLVENKLHQDLILISRIRDKVIDHHDDLDFTAPSISKLCNELGYVASLKNGNSVESLGLEEWMEGPRNQFIITAIMVSQRLLTVC
jgi:DNA-binding MltR family transcriptional regulator